MNYIAIIVLCICHGTAMFRFGVWCERRAQAQRIEDEKVPAEVIPIRR